VDNSVNENGFYVERSTDGGLFTRIAFRPLNSTTYRDQGLTPGQIYTYRVQATLGGLTSPYSNQATATSSRPGRLKVTPGSIDFGRVRVGSRAEAEVQVENVGEGPLFYRVRALSAPFSVAPAPSSGVLPPGGKLRLTVRFVPVRRDTFDAVLSIAGTASPSPGTNVSGVNVLVRGRGR
jgi:hypothetical protein